MKHLVALLAFALVINASAQTNYDTVKIRPLKITETIYMLKGAGGNIGFLKGEDGALIIDNQFGPLSGKIAQAVVEEGGGEIKMLINTHIHGDHTGGNDNFKKWGVTIVAHDNVRERMMKEGKVRDRVVPPRDKAAWPVVTFPDRMNIHWNNEDLELYHFNTGHTDGDVIIKFAKANVIHTGDMFVRYGYPFVDTNSGGGINGFIATLDQMLKIMDDDTKIIPGHGELATKKDVQAFRDRLVEIRDGVAAALKKGTKTEDIGNLPIASKYDADWGKGFVKGKDFVMMVAENLGK
ncbi:MAG TPA: MBL fold metallo-hydrolase, partial [Cyclobacteriaceae bacterium]|nr:MBL fold metallo-hydrolase [Cyclobacteriaceae bacterium]